MGPSETLALLEAYGRAFYVFEMTIAGRNTEIRGRATPQMSLVEGRGVSLAEALEAFVKASAEQMGSCMVSVTRFQQLQEALEALGRFRSDVGRCLWSSGTNGPVPCHQAPDRRCLLLNGHDGGHRFGEVGHGG